MMDAVYYKHLEETGRHIRLIRLAPQTPKKTKSTALKNRFKRFFPKSSRSKERAEVSCTFMYASLDDAPQYEAISYAWGDLADKQAILLGHNPFLVTRSLYSALEHLRLPTEERILWVDALCINQDDNNERTHQVGLMGGIYKQASSVIVWVGEQTVKHNAAMDFIEKVGQNSNLHLRHATEPCLVVNGLTVDDPELRQYVIQFLDLPWWHRLWTVQEYLLARKVTFQCGNRPLAGITMIQFKNSFFTHAFTCCAACRVNVNHVDRETGQNLHNAVSSIHSLERTRVEDYPFLDELATFRDREASDPRDKIYGMLALAQGKCAALIEPSYTISPRQVYEDTLVSFIRRTGFLNIFSHIYGRRNLILPSYVPDWTADIYGPGTRYNMRYDWLHCMLDGYSASGQHLASIVDFTPSRLTLNGFFFDRIAAKTSGQLFDRDEASIVREWESCAEASSPSPCPYQASAAAREQALWRAIIGNRMVLYSSVQARKLSDETDRPTYQRWRDWILTSGSPHLVNLDTELKEFDRTSVGVSGYRRFIRTEKGYIGFAPAEVQVGDHVAVLYGGKVPYILRQRAENTSSEFSGNAASLCYEMLGDSYIHGIMDGEFVDLMDKQGTPPESITLV